MFIHERSWTFVNDNKWLWMLMNENEHSRTFIHERSRTFMNDYEWLWTFMNVMNLHERLWMIKNDYERSWTFKWRFMNVQTGKFWMACIENSWKTCTFGYRKNSWKRETRRWDFQICTISVKLITLKLLKIN